MTRRGNNVGRALPAAFILAAGSARPTSAHPPSLPSGEARGGKCRAFTLVEVMLAVLVMALLASAVAFSFSSPIRAARAQDAVDQLRTFDNSARTLARNTGRPVRIAFDLTNNVVSRREGTDLDETTAATSPPVGYHIDRVRVEGRDYEDFEGVIDYSPLGLSRSYAVHVTGPQFDRWVMFAGMTGHVTELNDEGAMDSILSNAAPTAYQPWDASRRHDAD